MRTSDKNCRQRGVALLFALGILSLILVMGLAFLGNALITQKMSFNSRESASAQTLARSAVDRAVAHLTLFNFLQASTSCGTYVPDAASVFSRKSSGEINAGTTKNTIVRDQIYTDSNPRLSVMRGFTDTPWYDGKQSLAEWIYVHENGKESNGSGESHVTGSNETKIIGRFAYQVLPASSNSRLSLYAVTSGINALNNIAPGGTNYSTSRVPHLHRWGIDVNELVIPDLGNMFSTYWGIDANNAYPPQYEFDNFINLLSGTKAPNPFASDNTVANDKLMENRKRWLEHIFAEGKGRMAREAYYGGTDDAGNLCYFPRFNLTATTKIFVGSAYNALDAQSPSTGGWYQRFAAQNLNDVQARESFSHTGGSPKDTYLDEFLDKYLAYVPLKDKDHYYTDSYTYDADYKKVISLPFFRRIGNKGEMGAFSSVEHLRKQIAANFNDYCDPDSIPTSDVPPSVWGNRLDNSSSAATVAPNYTGNEKSPSVNEVAFGVKFENSKMDVVNGKCVFSPGMKAELISELVSVYKGIDGSADPVGQILSGTKLFGKLHSFEVELKVSIKGSVAVSYKEGTPEEEVSKTVNLPSGGVETTGSVKFTEGTAGKFTISEFKKCESANYWIGKTDLTADSAAVNIDLTDKVQAADSTLSGKTITVKSVAGVSDIKVVISAIRFNLGNLALEYSATNNFVDFVRVAHGSREYSALEREVFAGGWIATSELSSKTAAAESASAFYLGAMQAIDPRQNLWANLADSIRANDWLLSATHSLETVAAPTTFDWAKIETRLKSKVNDYSSPAAPKYADGGLIPGDDVSDPAHKDIETATDPAWRGDDPGQHISTAVIRNAPMRSPWELGFIHRGIPFQTLNLKKAGGIGNTNATSTSILDENDHSPDKFTAWNSDAGTNYISGDAGILDQIKMTEYNKSYGKVDFSALKKPAANYLGAFGELDSFNLAVFKGLFENLKHQIPHQFITGTADTDWKKITSAYVAGSDVITGTAANPATVALINGSPDTKLRSKVLGTTDAMFNALTKRTDQKNDAAREELIGKTINLTEGTSASLPHVFKIIVVAQTIRDNAGDIGKMNIDNQLVMAKSAAGLGAGTEAKIGAFDAKIDSSDIDKSIYFDDILGECRMLVTVEKIHYMEGSNPRTRLRVKQIEYLD